MADTTDATRSRVFRQVLTVEVLWHADPDGSDGPGPHGERETTDWEGEIRDAISTANGNAQVGACVLSPTEELHGG